LGDPQLPPLVSILSHGLMTSYDGVPPLQETHWANGVQPNLVEILPGNRSWLAGKSTKTRRKLGVSIAAFDYGRDLRSNKSLMG
jgi:hypothetical protein